ncbi:hypothetical protein ACQY0O_000960 [Thecaphora frezii]
MGLIASSAGAWHLDAPRPRLLAALVCGLASLTLPLLVSPHCILHPPSLCPSMHRFQKASLYVTSRHAPPPPFLLPLSFYRHAAPVSPTIHYRQFFSIFSF